MVGGRERKKHVGESGDLEEWEIGRLVRMGVKRECNTSGEIERVGVDNKRGQRNTWARDWRQK